jgi:hypothetical protein
MPEHSSLRLGAERLNLVTKILCWATQLVAIV